MPPCGCGEICVGGVCVALCDANHTLCGCSACCDATQTCDPTTGVCNMLH
jgi:hypothetical protein